MSRQRTLAHPRSCPFLLSSLLVDDIYNLAVHCLTQHARLPQLWHRAVKPDIQSRSQQRLYMLWASLFPAFQGQCQEQEIFQPQELICLSKAALVQEELATI